MRGGDFEIPLLPVGELNDQGQLIRIDLFDPERPDEAWARFQEIAGTAASMATGQTEFSNAPTRLNQRFLQAWKERDWDAIAAIHNPGIRIDDRRKLMQLETIGESALEQFRFFSEQPESRWEITPLATRGERLALSRIVLHADAGHGGGPLFIEYLVVDVAGEDERLAEMVLFDPGECEAAYAELDARYEAGEGKAHPHGLAAYRDFNDALAKRDWEAIKAMCSPDVVDHDHRRLAVLGTSRGPEAWMKNFKTLVELAGDTRYRTEHLVARGRGIFSAGTWCGSHEGGEYELPLVPVIELDEQGRILRTDIYDLEQMEEARLRFEEIGSAEKSDANVLMSADPLFNAASRKCDELSEAFRQGEVNRLRPLMSSDFLFSDRRKTVQLDLGYEETVKFTQSIEAMTERSIRSELLATRGERLALLRLRTEVAGDLVGPSEFHHLNLYEVDERGLLKSVVRWDEDDLDAAYAELDARYEEGEGAGDPEFVSLGLSFREGFRTGQFEAVLQRCSPDFVRYDHRPLAVLGTAHGAEAWLQEMKSLIELAPDAVLRNHHLRLKNRASLTVATWYGTREGGNFEIPIVLVLEADAETQLVRADLYDPEQIARAFARFEETGRAKTGANETASRFENLATQVGRSGVRCIEANEFEEFRAMLADSFRHIDRRKMAQLELDRDQYVEFTRDVAGGRSVRVRVDVIATRGERLALLRILAEIEQGDVGPELEHLNVLETDAGGRLLRQVRFDADDLDAAFEDLEARFLAGEDAHWGKRVEFLLSHNSALARRDWNALAALYGPEIVARDHRLVGWGTLIGHQEFLKSLQEMVALAPDARMIHSHVRMGPRGFLNQSYWEGTRDGGRFESPFIGVTELNGQGYSQRIDFYDPEQIDRAMARFEELKPAELLHLRMPSYIDGRSNPVLRAWRAWLMALDAGLNADDWEPVRAITSPDVRFEDRQRRALVSGDRELMIESLRARKAQDARVEASLLGMAGERVAAVRMLWSGGPAEGRFEIEYLGLIDIDEAGLLTATILFDADALHDLQREMWDRWAAIEPSCRELMEAMRGLLSFNARDGEGLRRAMAPDLCVEDHRRTGMGRLDGPDAYLKALEALWELSESSHADIGWFWLAQEGNLGLTFLHLTGTNADGGAFESESLYLVEAENGRVKRLELFEMDAMDRALARFEELCPEPSDPLRIPPNAATRAIREIGACRANGDVERLRNLVAPDFLFDDRKKRSLVKAGVEEWMRALEFLWREADAHPKERLVATAGDRLALHRVDWHEAPGESRFDIEGYRLIELEDSGLIHALILFDADDQASAHTELFRRYVAQGADDAPRGVVDFLRGMNEHDAELIRTALSDDFVLEDHRHAGMGRIEGVDAYLEAFRALESLSPNFQTGLLHTAVVAPHGRVSVMRTVGSNTEGGEVELISAALALYAGDRIGRMEFYEPEDLEIAIGRLNELRATRDEVIATD